MGCSNSTSAGSKKTGAPQAVVPSKPQVVFVLGGPGAGKGTMCTRLAEEYGMVHLSAGDLLRAERNGGGEQADLINEYITAGKIVPVEITVKLIKAAMEKAESSLFLIDGFPRDKENVRGWDEVMGTGDDAFARVAFVLFYDASEEVMTERILGRAKEAGDSARKDDNLESLAKRFATFRDESMPVVEEFEAKGKVRRVDAGADRDTVFAASKAIFDAEIRAHAEEEEKSAVVTTFAWVKPDVVAAGDGKVEEYLGLVRAAGFEIVEQRRFTPSKELAEEFYEEHKGKPFYDGLVAFMSGGDAVALALRHPEGDTIKRWRATLGPTNSNKAREEAPESIRAKLGTDGSQNAGHGSDSVESAQRELKLVFPDKDF